MEGEESCEIVLPLLVPVYMQLLTPKVVVIFSLLSVV